MWLSIGIAAGIIAVTLIVTVSLVFGESPKRVIVALCEMAWALIAGGLAFAWYCVTGGISELLYSKEARGRPDHVTPKRTFKPSDDWHVDDFDLPEELLRK